MSRKIKSLLLLLLAVILFAGSIPFSSGAAAANPFDDVSSGAYYHDAVLWAYEKGVTTGTSANKFSPLSTCTRGQVVTFLWRAMGEPEPASSDNPFDDVRKSDYYFKAILWAVEKGITNGTGARSFSPGTTCSNAHILTFIWRTVGEPGKTGKGEWYSDAVSWADGSGLISGTYNGSFTPMEECPRANVVTYLYRYSLAGAAELPNIGNTSTFWVRFIDVGQGDAALVQCDGHYMLIDGGDKASSDLIYSVLKSESVRKLDILVASHPHEDHVGGLAGALNYAGAGLTLCSATDYDSKAFENFKKYASKNGNGIRIPEAGDTYKLGSADIIILAVNSTEDTNNSSIELKITYGSTSFLFAGDNERDAEQVILNSEYAAQLSATVLKVGHHGSADSTSYQFLNEVMPEIAVISCGKDNSYGFPKENVLSRLRDEGAKVYRTDLQGDILCTSDGSNVSVSVEKNADADTLLAPSGTVEKINPAGNESGDDSGQKQTRSLPDGDGKDYVLNTNTKKFHFTWCSSVKTIADKNRMDYHGTRDSVISMGYEPCKKCNP